MINKIRDNDVVSHVLNAFNEDDADMDFSSPKITLETITDLAELTRRCELMSVIEGKIFSTTADLVDDDDETPIQSEHMTEIPDDESAQIASDANGLYSSLKKIAAEYLR